VKRLTSVAVNGPDLALPSDALLSVKHLVRYSEDSAHHIALTFDHEAQGKWIDLDPAPVFIVY
ncbi:MAG: hypothetical protein AAF125_02140, partial [Chloroflexota bacterium]